MLIVVVLLLQRALLTQLILMCQMKLYSTAVANHYGMDRNRLVVVGIDDVRPRRTHLRQRCVQGQETQQKQGQLIFTLPVFQTVSIVNLDSREFAQLTSSLFR